MLSLPCHGAVSDVIKRAGDVEKTKLDSENSQVLYRLHLYTNSLFPFNTKRLKFNICELMLDFNFQFAQGRY